MSNKKLLYVINSLNSGGAERGILTLIKSGFFDDVELNLVAIHKGSGPLIDEIKSLDFNGNVHYCDDNENLSVIAMIKALLYVIKFLAVKRPKYLMLSLTQSNLIGCFAGVFFPRLKVISFLHNAGFSKNIYKYLLWIFSFRVNACLYDSQKTHITMKPTFMKSKKRSWHYVPLVAISNQSQKNSYELNKPVQIFSAGRLNGQKNYSEAIRAISKIKQSGINIIYLIAGEGEEESNLKDLAKSLDVEGNVKFLGFVPDWLGLAKESDIFLMCSEYEGLSIVTVEAMAAAIPVIATNVGEIVNYGAHNENMIKSDSTNAEDLARAINSLILDEELRKKIAHKAQADMINSFSEDGVRKTNRSVAEKLFH